jgi:DNA-binding HxlR family transcriptional regulator
LCRALPGIRRKVLTAQLGELELDGVASRNVVAAKRTHVEYSLAPFGERLRGLILQRHDLALQNCAVLKRRPPTGRL